LQELNQLPHLDQSFAANRILKSIPQFKKSLALSRGKRLERLQQNPANIIISTGCRLTKASSFRFEWQKTACPDRK